MRIRRAKVRRGPGCHRAARDRPAGVRRMPWPAPAGRRDYW